MTDNHYFKRDSLWIFNEYNSFFNRQTKQLRLSFISRHIRHISI